MFGIVKKIFGTAQGRLLKKYGKIVAAVNAAEKRFQSLSDEQLKGKTEEFKERLKKGETVDSLLPEAYAVVKNACRRLCGTEVHVSGYNQLWDMIPYDVQILGGIAMHYGAISEMQTGEGKTLTAAMPLYLNALTGGPVHLVTVNDYLATRDCAWIGAIFRFLGLRAEALTHDIPPHARKEVYAADIVYGTASEFGFDYLRDNSMAHSKEDQCQRGHYFAIVDEIDSILIDEARTPLIISGPSSQSRHLYDELKVDVDNLVRHQRDLCNRLVTEGRKTLEKLGVLQEEAEKPKLSKEQEEQELEAIKKLWLVGKGTPQNKVLKKIKENPRLRSLIEKKDIYFHADVNKEEKFKTLAELFIIVEERSSEFELTDRGIQQWLSDTKEKSSSDDFMMLDLGDEYAKIDGNPDLGEEEKIQAKVKLREQDAARKERAHNLRQLLRAHLMMEKDVDYIVADAKIVIIDENTGRPQPGRRFSDGLHQAIEAKEGLTIQAETQTYATITLQNYFRLYKKLAGMTGTAMTEATEFKEIYKLEVLSIPTHRKSQRADTDDEIYMTEREKYNAVLKEVQKVHAEGRPILIGTESVEASEKLSRILKQNKLEHTVLNAKHHEQEAEIIAKAGSAGAIMVATNMAGRGTDIKLESGVAEKGGLHVIGTTRHQSRRIDRQLRGRCARQGDPGSSKFFVSFEDSLMRLFSSPRITAFLEKFRPPEGEAISAKILNKSIETAQKRVEQRNYTMRKHTLEYDDVMNKQRSEIYAFRNDVLHTEDPIALAKEVLESIILQMASRFNASQDRTGFHRWLVAQFPLSFDTVLEENAVLDTVLSAFEYKLDVQKERVEKTQALFASRGPIRSSAEEVLREVVRSILIRNVDRMWQEHLLHIDHLRTEVSLRAIGQKDPLLEFKHEAFALFDKLSVSIKQEIAHTLFKFEMMVPEVQSEQAPKLLPKRRPLIDLSLLPELEVPPTN
ncbi:MAG: protein translocase subunit secA [Chlamydiota bacterium]|jgi:preprotein translocase subunit SecA